MTKEEEFQLLERMIECGGATITATDSSLYGPVWIVELKDGRHSSGHLLGEVILSALEETK